MVFCRFELEFWLIFPFCSICSKSVLGGQEFVRSDFSLIAK